MSAPESTVVDDPDNDRFLSREGDVESVLRYWVGDGRLVLLHTEVPDALRGRGIAGRLVQAVVDRAAASRVTVLPWCPYTRKWLSEHPDDAARIAIDWSDPPETSAEAQARLSALKGGRGMESKSGVGVWIGDIEDATLTNTSFRSVIFTGSHTQLTVMSLRVGQEIGWEAHGHLDQFLRIEQGQARVDLGATKVSHPGFGAVPIPGPSGLGRGDCCHGQTEQVQRRAATPSDRGGDRPGPQDP